jgi:hypothetical protein
MFIFKEDGSSFKEFVKLCGCVGPFFCSSGKALIRLAHVITVGDAHGTPPYLSLGFALGFPFPMPLPPPIDHWHRPSLEGSPPKPSAAEREAAKLAGSYLQV